MTSPYLDTSPTDLKNRTTAVRFVAADGGRSNYADESGPSKPHRPYPDELYGHELTERRAETEPNHRDKDEWLDYQEHHEDEHEPQVVHSYQMESARGDGGRGDEGHTPERGKSKQRALHQAPQQQGQQPQGSGGGQGQPRRRRQSGNAQSGSRDQSRQRQDQQRRNYQSGQAVGKLNPERTAGGSGNRGPADRNREQRTVDDPYGGELIPRESGGGQGHGDRQQASNRQQGGHSQGRRQSRHGQGQQGSRGQAPRHGQQQSGSRSQQRRQHGDQTRRPGPRQPQQSQQRHEHRRDSGHRRHQQQGRQGGGGSHREQAEHRDLPGQQHQHQSGAGHRPEGSGQEPPHERAREERDRRGPDAATHWKGGS